MLDDRIELGEVIKKLFLMNEANTAPFKAEAFLWPFSISSGRIDLLSSGCTPSIDHVFPDGRAEGWEDLAWGGREAYGSETDLSFFLCPLSLSDGRKYLRLKCMQLSEA